MTILKQEINATLAANLELVKWKLAVLSILTGIGLGVLHEFNPLDQGYLLLFLAPYVCVYIDLLVAEREARIHHIAKYLREYTGDDVETRELRDYELAIQARRNTKTSWFRHEHNARLLSSLVAGIGIPLLTLFVNNYRLAIQAAPWLVLIPAVGVALILRVYFVLQDQLLRLDAPAAPAGPPPPAGSA